MWDPSPTQIQTLKSNKMKIVILKVKFCFYHHIYEFKTTGFVPNSLVRHERFHFVTELNTDYSNDFFSYLERIKECDFTGPSCSKIAVLKPEKVFWTLWLWYELRWYTACHCWPKTIKQNKNEPTNPSQSAHSPPLPSLKKEKRKNTSIDYY